MLQRETEDIAIVQQDAWLRPMLVNRLITEGGLETTATAQFRSYPPSLEIQRRNLRRCSARYGWKLVRAIGGTVSDSVH